MNVSVVGDADGRFSEYLGRYLRSEIVSGYPTSADQHAVVVSSSEVPDEIITAEGIEGLVLIEPGLAEHDRVVRMLAGRSRPKLEVVEHVAARIQAERTWALLLSLLTGIQPAADALRAHSVKRSDLIQGPPAGGNWAMLPRPRSAAGQTLGFVGFGPMAWHMSLWARQAGMEVVYTSLAGVNVHDPVEMDGAAIRSGASKLAFEDVLASADALVLDVEYSEQTIRLIDSPELALMPHGVLLVNTAHGRAIDEGALLQALRDGQLGGAALDRFNYEPLPADSPLREFDRLLLTPGVAIPDDEDVLQRTAQRVARRFADMDAGPETRRVRYLRRRAMSGRRP